MLHPYRCLLMAVFLMPLFTLAYQPDPASNPSLKLGQCAANIYSKKYLDDKSTPSTVYYTCSYRCMGPQEQIFQVTAESAADRNLAKIDGSVGLCDGVAVVSKYINGNQIWDFDRVIPFWAQGSPHPEIKTWVRDHQAQIPEPEFSQMKIEFLQKIAVVANAYEQAGKNSANFKEAAKILKIIISRTPEGEAVLADCLQELAAGSQTEVFSGRGLALTVIATNGRFLIP